MQRQNEPFASESNAGARDHGTRPRVTAIVLNWCAEEDTAMCVRALQASRDARVSIVLVDNASPDGSGPRLHRRFPDTPFISMTVNAGYCGGNNRGIEWALEHGCEYVLIVNDDAVVDPGCVAALVATAEKTGAAAVGPQIRSFDDRGLVTCGPGHFSTLRALGVPLEYRRELDTEEAPSNVTFVSGCCVLLRAEDLRVLGGFDPTYFAYVEDAELSFRFVHAGRLLVYEPSARVFHRVTAGARPTPFQIRLRDRNRRRLVARHYGIVDRLRFAAWFYTTRCVLIIGALLRGNRATATALMQGSFGKLDVPA